MTDAINLNVARAIKKDDNRLVSVRETLQATIDEIDNGREVTSAILLLLDDSKDEHGKRYDTTYRACRLSCSEMLALLELSKQDVLRTMGVLD